MLAELEEEQQRKPKKRVEVLSMEFVDPAEFAGYNPYDNPGTSKTGGTPMRSQPGAANCKTRNDVAKRRRERVP